MPCAPHACREGDLRLGHAAHHLAAGAGLLLALPGFFDARLAYGMLVWDGLVLLAAIRDGLRLAFPAAITVERSWSNAPALDSETEIELAVEQSRRTILDCSLIDDLPAALVAAPATQKLRVSRLGAALRYKIEPRERGDALTGAVYIRYASPLGLVERWAMAPLEQTMRVYPALRQGEDQQIFLARGRQIDLQLRQARQRGLGRDFESLREYLEGDDLRDVCWTATARRGQLITRRYQTERSQAVWIVLDAGRLLQGRILRETAKMPSLATRSSTTRAPRRLLWRNLRFVFRRPCRPAGLRAACAAARAARPRPGASTTDRRSAGAGRAEASEADHLRATATLNRWQPRRALILWITDLAETAMRPEVIDGAMQLLRRHVLLFVAMAQPDVEAIANARPKNVAQMFRASAAQELASRRELLLARLREQGALTLDLDPEHLTSAVLNQYLKVKERAMV